MGPSCRWSATSTGGSRFRTRAMQCATGCMGRFRQSRPCRVPASYPARLRQVHSTRSLQTPSCEKPTGPGGGADAWVNGAMMTAGRWRTSSGHTFRSRPLEEHVLHLRRHARLDRVRSRQAAPVNEYGDSLRHHGLGNREGTRTTSPRHPRRLADFPRQPRPSRRAVATRSLRHRARPVTTAPAPAGPAGGRIPGSTSSSGGPSASTSTYSGSPTRW